MSESLYQEAIIASRSIAKSSSSVIPLQANVEVLNYTEAPQECEEIRLQKLVHQIRSDMDIRKVDPDSFDRFYDIVVTIISALVQNGHEEACRVINRLCEADQCFAEIVNGTIEKSNISKFVKLWDFDNPSELEWVVAGLVPSGFISLIIGDGGSGKTYIAMLLALSIVSGQSFLGIKTQKRRVLWVDTEMDVDEVKRRECRVLQGMGASSKVEWLSDNFYYLNLTKPINEEKNTIETFIQKHNIEVLILDSLSVAIGGDASSQADVTPFMALLRDLGVTVIALDHVSAAQRNENANKIKSFGSIFKRNLARSSINIVRKGDTITIFPDKSNFGPQAESFDVKMIFAPSGDNPTSVRFERQKEKQNHERQSLSDFTQKEQVMSAMKALWQEDKQEISAKDIQAYLKGHSINLKTKIIGTRLKALNDEGKVSRIKRGRYKIKGLERDGRCW